MGVLRDVLGGAGAREPAARAGLAGRQPPAAGAPRAAPRVRRRARAPRRLPALGLWPAAGSLFVFLWLELVSPHRSDPAVVGGFLIGYAVVQLGAGAVVRRGVVRRRRRLRGRTRRVIARLSPWGRRDDGRLVLRSPLAARDQHTGPARAGRVVVVLLGSTAFDGLSRTVFWQSGPGAANDAGQRHPRHARDDRPGRGDVPARHPALRAGWPASRRGIQPRRYAATVIPIALGYTVAHYFSLFVLDGQTTWILVSNPFGTAGTDLFGTYRNVVDLTAVSAAAIALVQVGAIVVGHVVGVTLAHERALLSARRARASDQLPLVVVMVLFTFGGLGLLFGF